MQAASRPANIALHLIGTSGRRLQMRAFERFRFLPLIGFAAILIAATATAVAQEALATEDKATQETEPVVVVEGIRRDRAMDAFLHGDFETAEIEFKNNWRCIWRNERLAEASIRQAASDAISASLSPTGGGLGDVNVPKLHNMPLSTEEIAERTCHSPEWQFYMIALSQIQLGKRAEAKESLYRATRLSRDELMFDAHYRIALLELLDGDVKRANRQLAHLTGMQRSCRNRGTRCEVHADLDAATTYLKRAIADARRGKS